MMQDQVIHSEEFSHGEDIYQIIVVSDGHVLTISGSVKGAEVHVIRVTVEVTHDQLYTSAALAGRDLYGEIIQYVREYITRA